MPKYSSILATCVLLFGSHLWAESYKIDESHTEVGFKIKHLVISTVSGRFNKFSGQFEFNEKTGEIKALNVQIDAASIDTNEADRDKHLRSEDFFHTEKFKELIFTSEKTITKKGQPTAIEGKLTIRGVTKRATLNIDYKGKTTDPWGNQRIAFEATTQVKRSDFGLTWNKNLDKGGVMIGDDVKVLIEGEALLQK